MRLNLSASARFGLALLLSSVVSVSLFITEAFRNQSTYYGYLNWNLFLAWLPFLFGIWLVRVLRRKLWSSWEALLASVLWLGFLPNSFYVISDLIHINEVSRVDIMSDIAMFASFAFSSAILGFASLYMIHSQLLKRVSAYSAGLCITLVLFLSSFAIYLGRELRWNTWDIIVNPGGILFDISDRLLHPGMYPEMFSTTYSFFVLLGSLYIVIWYMMCLNQQKN